MAGRSPRLTANAAHLRPRASTCFRVSSAGRISTATMSAPASASASAMPWPRPRAAPVTRATLLSSRKDWRTLAINGSIQHLDRRGIHVGELLVLAAHAPDEAVGRGADAEVHGPGGRHDGLPIAHHHAAQ